MKKYLIEIKKMMNDCIEKYLPDDSQIEEFLSYEHYYDDMKKTKRNAWANCVCFQENYG